MKHYSTISLAIAVLLSESSAELYAQQNWAMVMIENGNEKPTLVEYFGFVETAENGIEYHRIYDYSYIFSYEGYNPVKLQYGYRFAEKQIFIYDFETQKETLAFDFNLSAGNQFTTFNGMEWMVESAKDTLVNISERGVGDYVNKRLLSVRTLDGTLSDQWLEDFGSFVNHFMINSLENVRLSQTLWMEYDCGEYLAREICADPIFAHDSGWMEATYEWPMEDVSPKCTYENGQVVFENVQWSWEHRDYTCFYRDGDDIYKVFRWELEPHVDGGSEVVINDVITFKGLPSPESGKYVIHFNDNEYPTGISIIGIPSLSTGCFYDVSGRKSSLQPTNGIYFNDGKKKYAK